MSEEEKILEFIKQEYGNYDNYVRDLLDLYNKEKEKNKELENADLTTVYMNGFYDGEKKWKDKIKEKMQQDIYTNEHTILGGRRNGKTLEYGIRLGRIQVCEELLEERK